MAATEGTWTMRSFLPSCCSSRVDWPSIWGMPVHTRRFNPAMGEALRQQDLEGAMKILLAFLLILGPTSALAETIDPFVIVTGTTFFNKPHATLADHNADFARCALQTNILAAPKNGVPIPEGPHYGSVLAQALTGPIAAAIWGDVSSAFQASHIENCMIVAGWRVVRLSNDAMPDPSSLSVDALKEKMSALVGLESPPGVIVRSWRNDALHPRNIRSRAFGKEAGKGQLSFRVFTPPSDLSVSADRVFTRTNVKIAIPWVDRSLKFSEIPSIPVGAGVIIAKVKGMDVDSTPGLFFEKARVYPIGEHTSSDGSPDIIRASMSHLLANKEGNWFIFAVPPGEWRIRSLGYLSFCLGSPSFSVSPGEAVFAGAFDIDGENLGPNLDLAEVKPLLSTGVVEHLKAAEYRNGSLGNCHSILTPYALEFPQMTTAGSSP